MRAYFLLDYTSSSSIEVEQIVKDFDPKQGYARIPGYTETAIKILRGEIEPNINSFTVVRGHRAEDLIVGTIAGQFFLSCNAGEVFCKAQVKGLKLRDVTVQTPAGEHLCYKRLIATERCGTLRCENEDDEDAQIDIYSCSDLPKSDLCVPDGTAAIICFDRLADVIKEHRLRIEMLPIELLTASSTDHNSDHR